ncbi:MAG: hypothetical protein ACOZDY_08900 [Pseudomonadota bacterium]
MKYTVEHYAPMWPGLLTSVIAQAATLAEARAVVRDLLRLKRLPAQRRWSGERYVEAYSSLPPSAAGAQHCGGLGILEAGGPDAAG